ncbi:hypothetical protein [Streptomyces sp. NBC_00057]|uniref:hypothetical protein n=1 Tax=Streptomyces sp. NBC_00057 TaxID=2975634 RepID=UPI003244B535
MRKRIAIAAVAPLILGAGVIASPSPASAIPPPNCSVVQNGATFELAAEGFDVTTPFTALRNGTLLTQGVTTAPNGQANIALPAGPEGTFVFQTTGGVGRTCENPFNNTTTTTKSDTDTGPITAAVQDHDLGFAAGRADGKVSCDLNKIFRLRADDKSTPAYSKGYAEGLENAKTTYAPCVSEKAQPKALDHNSDGGRDGGSRNH